MYNKIELEKKPIKQTNKIKTFSLAHTYFLWWLLLYCLSTAGKKSKLTCCSIRNFLFEVNSQEKHYFCTAAFEAMFYAFFIGISLIIQERKRQSCRSDMCHKLKKCKHKEKHTYSLLKRFCLNMTWIPYHPLIILSNAPMGKIQDVVSSTSEWTSCLLLSPWMS